MPSVPAEETGRAFLAQGGEMGTVARATCSSCWAAPVGPRLLLPLSPGLIPEVHRQGRGREWTPACPAQPARQLWRGCLSGEQLTRGHSHGHLGLLCHCHVLSTSCGLPAAPVCACMCVCVCGCTCVWGDSRACLQWALPPTAHLARGEEPSPPQLHRDGRPRPAWQWTRPTPALTTSLCSKWVLLPRPCRAPSPPRAPHPGWHAASARVTAVSFIYANPAENRRSRNVPVPGGSHLQLGTQGQPYACSIRREGMF